MEANTWNTSRPAGVVVSMSSARDRKPAAFALIASMMSSRLLKKSAVPNGFPSSRLASLGFRPFEATGVRV
jgi:hypothetical protein